MYYVNRPVKFRNAPLIKAHNSDDNEDDWITEDAEFEFTSDETTSSSGSNTNILKINKKHFPPKSKELSPGFTLPVEVN